MRKFLIGCSAASLLLLWGCGGSKETSEAPKTEAPAAAPAAAPVSDAEAATVTGKVSFTGVNGPIKFEKDGPAGKESGQSKPSIFVVQVRDGKVALPDFMKK